MIYRTVIKLVDNIISKLNKEKLLFQYFLYN